MVQKNVLILFVVITLAIGTATAYLSFNLGQRKGYLERRSYEIKVLQPIRMKNIEALLATKNKVIVIYKNWKPPKRCKKRAKALKGVL